MALIDRIKFDALSDDLLVWKFPSEELKLGTQLIVNESQEAVFYKGGEALDVFGPGTHTLSTGNLPLIHKIVNLPFGGKTPFTAEVWYVNKIAKRDMKWGTKGSIQVLDPIYNYPVSMRAFGQWGLRIFNSRSFLTQIVTTLKETKSEMIYDYFIGEILQKFSNYLANFFAETKTSSLQISTKLNELSEYTYKNISVEFNRFGIEIINFNVERVSIPEEELNKLQEILGKKMEMEQMSQVQVGAGYTTMRTFDTMEKAAANEGGNAGSMLGAGLGVGMGVGVGNTIGQQMGQAMNTQSQQNVPNQDDSMQKLQKLKQMLDSGLITQQDFDEQKKQILANL